MRKMTRPSRVAMAALTLLCLSAPALVHAQTREDLIIQAFAEFDATRQRELLRAALNPALGAPDSIFGVGVQALAQNLIDSGQESLADVWLKWGIRSHPGMSADTLLFPQSVISAYRVAEEAVGGATTADLVSFLWPDQDVGGPQGEMLALSADLSVEPLVLVQGFGILNLRQPLALDPGTYSVEASAAGRVGSNLEIEVLPGMTTVLAFNLATRGDAQIAETLELAALNSLVRITGFRMGEASCGTGFFAGADGLILTTYRAIRGAEDLQVEAAGTGVIDNVQVAAYDAALNVAVVQVPLQRSDSLPIATDAVDRSFVWGFSYPECGPAVTTLTRLTTTVGSELGLESEMVDGGQGGPLIDNTGAVVGLATGPTTALPIAAAESILDEARRNVVANQMLVPRLVAVRENHLFGRVELQSPEPGASVVITPLETWHWPEAGVTAELPTRFTGPMGRYQVNLMLAGEIQRQIEMSVLPGQLGELAVALSGGGSGKMIGILGGVGAAGALAVLVLGGGGDDLPPPGPPTSTGSITIVFPNP